LFIVTASEYSGNFQNKNTKVIECYKIRIFENQNIN